MTRRRWAAIGSCLLASVAIVGALNRESLAQSKPPAAAPADTTASPAKFQAAMAEWKSKIVPAAKKEGEVIWYSCAQATEAEAFFFQAEDGIRDYKVTGVQTCALPI